MRRTFPPARSNALCAPAKFIPLHWHSHAAGRFRGQVDFLHHRRRRHRPRSLPRPGIIRRCRYAGQGVGHPALGFFAGQKMHDFPRQISLMRE